MNPMPNPLRLLPWLDWLALIAFFAGWIGYATFAHRRAFAVSSLLSTTNRIRREWMLQATWRENRILDGSVVQTLSSSPSFFASTSILIIGGLLAALSASGQAAQVVGTIPFAVPTSSLVFELKLLLLTAVFTYGFFCFSWSLRQYTFGALLLAALPEPARITASGMSREAFADRAGRVVGIAAESFNNGLRSYYLSFAVVGWFFSPLVFIVGTAGVIWVLYQREFHSEVLATLASEE